MKVMECGTVYRQSLFDGIRINGGMLLVQENLQRDKCIGVNLHDILSEKQ